MKEDNALTIARKKLFALVITLKSASEFCRRKRKTGDGNDVRALENLLRLIDHKVESPPLLNLIRVYDLYEGGKVEVYSAWRKLKNANQGNLQADPNTLTFHLESVLIDTEQLFSAILLKGRKKMIIEIMTKIENAGFFPEETFCHNASIFPQVKNLSKKESKEVYDFICRETESGSGRALTSLLLLLGFRPQKVG